MKILVTGSSGHLGEALVRTLQSQGRDVVGLDLLESPFTHVVGSIVDRECVRSSLQGVGSIIHTATLHKPHIVTHQMQDFIDTNISGTLILLEEAIRAGVQVFLLTSTTSTFGDALRPPPGQPAAWITEQVHPIPKNIYGITKITAEDLCQLFHKRYGLACLVLRTSRFFPEEDDDPAMRAAYADGNIKANEFLFRRVDLEDVVDAHLIGIERAPEIGFDRLIISATTPFQPEDLQGLRAHAPQIVEQRIPSYVSVYQTLGWTMFPSIDRVYINHRARQILGWQPRYSFSDVIECLRAGMDPSSPLARDVGSKGYHREHRESFEAGPYPVE